eukprot:scaffold38857_cov63-Phaeocystis_antarctica.AAC.8
MGTGRPRPATPRNARIRGQAWSSSRWTGCSVSTFSRLTLVLPRSYMYDRSAPRARDSHRSVVCTRPQAQIVGLGLLHPPIS